MPRRLVFAFIAMVAIDIVFIIISASEDIRGFQDHLHVSYDNGRAEQFQYLKWISLTAALGYRAIVIRSPMHGAWAILFLYLLIDDSQQIHERFGEQIAVAWKLHPMLGLRAQDFGELMVTAVATVPLAVLIGIAYAFAGKRIRIFCRTMMLLLVALAFFGVALDLIDIVTPWRWLQLACGVIEDGGEMIVASLMVAYGVGSQMSADNRRAKSGTLAA